MFEYFHSDCFAFNCSLLTSKTSTMCYNTYNIHVNIQLHIYIYTHVCACNFYMIYVLGYKKMRPTHFTNHIFEYYQLGIMLFLGIFINHIIGYHVQISSLIVLIPQQKILYNLESMFFLVHFFHGCDLLLSIVFSCYTVSVYENSAKFDLSYNEQIFRKTSMLSILGYLSSVEQFSMCRTPGLVSRYNQLHNPLGWIWVAF